MWRKIGAVVAGVLVVGVVVMTLQALGAVLYPMPEGLDPRDPAFRDALEEHIRGAPAATLLLAAASEVLGALLGGLTAGWIVRERKAAFAGAIFAVALAGSVLNWTSFAHPWWFIVGQLVAYPATFALTLRLLRADVPAPDVAADPAG